MCSSGQRSVLFANSCSNKQMHEDILYAITQDLYFTNAVPAKIRNLKLIITVSADNLAPSDASTGLVMATQSCFVFAFLNVLFYLPKDITNMTEKIAWYFKNRYSRKERIKPETYYENQWLSVLAKLKTCQINVQPRRKFFVKRKSQGLQVHFLSMTWASFLPIWINFNPQGLTLIPASTSDYTHNKVI